FFFSSRRRHTRFSRDWSSDVCSSDLDDLLDTALDYARAMAASAAPSSLRVIRRQLWRAHHQSYGDATAEAWDLLMTALAGDDFIEGVNSFLEKRPANFTGR